MKRVCQDSRYLSPTEGTCAAYPNKAVGGFMSPTQVDDCPDGYYPSGANVTGRTCRRCSEDCLKCTAGKCQECLDSSTGFGHGLDASELKRLSIFYMQQAPVSVTKKFEAMTWPRCGNRKSRSPDGGCEDAGGVATC